ncbi:hypothetical protein [Pseudomonas fulva]|uniref:hypothetical protein n=1 Tax=Pseudomonas fulva TaxID=47880 RepID=UPI0021ACB2A5|nr:hypothetical protein [Pseudomonas fulva]
MPQYQMSIEMILAFEEWATDRGMDVTSADGSAGPAFKNVETHAAWLGFEAAHRGAGVIRPGQQLHAYIKRKSEYAHQSKALFPVRVGKAPYGDYNVHGGPGGVYRMSDVEFYVIEDGKQYRIK